MLENLSLFPNLKFLILKNADQKNLIGKLKALPNPAYLKELHLNFIIKSNILSEITNMLPKIKRLKTNSIEETEEPIKLPKRLKGLHLYGKISCDTLTRLLSLVPSLEDLIISGNIVGNGFKDVLKKVPNLKQFDFYGEECKDLSIDAFIEALQEVPYLENLRVSYSFLVNLDEFDAKEKIVTLLDRCPMLKNLDMCEYWNKNFSDQLKITHPTVTFNLSSWL